ncbi:MAG: PPC domain-containing protein [Deltaproteobacteria bacterium]|nr:PPC domain-containing protein [Deltaproteobacteria bacterium]
MSSHGLGWLLLLVGPACDPALDVPDAGPLDSGIVEALQPPSPDALPERAPYTLATLRGRAPEARRVIVSGGPNPIATAVLPDSTFCIDVPTLVPGPYEFSLISQSVDGRLSAATKVTTAFDPTAPAIQGAQTCAGADPAGCTPRTEICDGQRDDDCDRLSDARDPDCSTCDDDVLEPNEDRNAPRIEPGRYDGLVMCPGSWDYYGVFVRTGERIDVRALFTHASGNLDLELQTDSGEVLGRSVRLNDDESISHTATATGQLEVVVFGDLVAANTYTLIIDITPP